MTDLITPGQERYLAKQRARAVAAGRGEKPKGFTETANQRLVRMQKEAEAEKVRKQAEEALQKANTFAATLREREAAAAEAAAAREAESKASNEYMISKTILSAPPRSQTIVQRAIEQQQKEQQQIQEQVSRTPGARQIISNGVNNERNKRDSIYNSGDLSGHSNNYSASMDLQNNKKTIKEKFESKQRTSQKIIESTTPAKKEGNAFEETLYVPLSIPGSTINLFTSGAEAGYYLIKEATKGKDRRSEIYTAYKREGKNAVPKTIDVVESFSTLDRYGKYNPEGAFNLAFTVLGIAEVAPTSPVKLTGTTIDIPTSSGSQSVRTFGFETGSRAQPLVSITPDGLKLGTPKVDLGQLKPGSSIVPETPLQTKIIRANLPKEASSVEFGGNVYPGATSEQIAATQNILRQTSKQKSAFITNKVIPETRSLNPPGVKEVVKFTKQEDGFIYGSFAQQQQLPRDINVARGLPGDIDVQLKAATNTEVAPKVERLAVNLRKAGNKARVVEGKTLIETVNPETGLSRHAVDIHTKEAPTLPGSPNPEQSQALGFSINQDKIKIESTEFQKLSEQGVRKAGSITTLRASEGGELFFAPEAHRVKDVKDFFFTQEALLRSKGLSASEAQLKLQPLRKLYPDTLFKSNIPDVPDVPPSPSKGVSISNVAYSGVGVLNTVRSPSIFGSPNNSGSVKVSIPNISSPRSLVSPSASSVRSSVGSRNASPSLRITSPSANVSPLASSSHSPSSPSNGYPSIPSPSIPQSGSIRSPAPSPISLPISPIRSPSPKSTRSPSRPSSNSSPSIPSISKTTESPPVGFLPKPSYKKKLVPGFDVFVKTKGEFLKANPLSLTEEQAFNLGASRVAKTSSASFKVVPSGTEAIGRFDLKVDKEQFRPSKRTPGVVVEKSRYRINTPGELREITFKGIATKRRGLL